MHQAERGWKPKYGLKSEMGCTATSAPWLPLAKRSAMYTRTSTQSVMTGASTILKWHCTLRCRQHYNGNSSAKPSKTLPFFRGRQRVPTALHHERLDVEFSHDISSSRYHERCPTTIKGLVRVLYLLRLQFDFKLKGVIESGFHEHCFSVLITHLKLDCLHTKCPVQLLNALMVAVAWEHMRLSSSLPDILLMTYMRTISLLHPASLLQAKINICNQIELAE